MSEQTIKNSYVKTQLTNALWDLLREKKFSDVTISEIVRKADVSRVSFYRNYKNKEDILRVRLDEITEKFKRETGVRYKDDNLQDYFITLFRHMERHKEICLTLYRSGMIELIKEQFDKSFLTEYKKIYGEFKASFYSGGIYNVFLLWLTRGCRESPEEMGKALSTILEKQ